MASTWELTHGVTTKTLAAWGVSLVDAEMTSQAPDVVTLELVTSGDSSVIELPDGTTSPGWAYLDNVTILKDSAQWFKGRVTRVPRFVSGDSERLAYEISGPWFDLESITYQQDTAERATGTAIEDPVTSHKTPAVVLGQRWTTPGVDAVQITTGAQIGDILDYALTEVSTFQKGTIDSGFLFPPVQATSITCADAIRQLLRLHPGWVAWFDYTTTPPTLHIRGPSGQTAASVPFTSATEINGGLQIHSRDDLVPSYVRIVYPQVTEVDGKAQRGEPVVDKYPAAGTGELRALHYHIDLERGSATTQRARIETRNLPAPKLVWDEDNDDWEINANFNADVDDESAWTAELKARIKEALPWLHDTDDNNWGILNNSWGQRLNNPVNTDDFPDEDGDGEPDNDEVVTQLYTDPPNPERVLPNEVVSGHIDPWIKEEDIHLKEAMLLCRVVIVWTDDATRNHDSVVRRFPEPWVDNAGNAYNGREVTFRVRATNASTRTYERLVSYEEPETPPDGVAQAVHDALSTLQYEGSLTLQKDEVDSTVGMGMKLNITGAGAGGTAWATMASPIQSYRPDIDNGRMSVTFGPPEHLSPQDFIELLRFVKLNPVSYVSEKERGEAQLGGNVPLSEGSYKGPEERSDNTALNPHPFKIKITKDVGAATYRVHMQPGIVWVDKLSGTTTTQNELHPEMDGTALNAATPPSKTITATDTVCWVKLTKNASTFVITDADIEFGASKPADTTTEKYRTIATLDPTGSDPTAENIVKENFYVPSGATGDYTFDFERPDSYDAAHLPSTAVPTDVELDFNNGKIINEEASNTLKLWDLEDYMEQEIAFIGGITFSSGAAPDGCVQIQLSEWSGKFLVRKGSASEVDDSNVQNVVDCSWKTLEYAKAVTVSDSGSCVDITPEHVKIEVPARASAGATAVSTTTSSHTATGTTYQAEKCGGGGP